MVYTFKNHCILLHNFVFNFRYCTSLSWQFSALSVHTLMLYCRELLCKEFTLCFILMVFNIKYYYKQHWVLMIQKFVSPTIVHYESLWCMFYPLNMNLWEGELQHCEKENYNVYIVNFDDITNNHIIFKVWCKYMCMWWFQVVVFVLCKKKMLSGVLYTFMHVCTVHPNHVLDKRVC